MDVSAASFQSALAYLFLLQYPAFAATTKYQPVMHFLPCQKVLQATFFGHLFLRKTLSLASQVISERNSIRLAASF
jgi:hypothetical protein